MANKKYFNEKQIEILSKHEEYFNTVVHLKYKRASSNRVNDEVADIYEDVTGEVVKRNWTCAHCIYALFEQCGKLYYESVEQLNKTKTKETENKTKSKSTKQTKQNKSSKNK